jgi:hypothetical protein
MTFIPNNPYDIPAILAPLGVTTVGGRTITPTNKFGKYDTLATGTVYDGYANDADYKTILNAFTSAVALDVISVAGADTVAGTGAQVIEIQGIDGSYASKTVSVNTNGGTVSGIDSSSTWFGVHRIKVTQAGTGHTNAGNIEVVKTGTGGGSTNEIAMMTLGFGQSNMAVYFVPTGHTALVTRWWLNYDRSTGAPSTIDAELIEAVYNPASGSTYYKVRDHHGLVTSTSSGFQHEYNPYKSFAGKSVIMINAAVGANTIDAHAGFDLYLIAD